MSIHIPKVNNMSEGLKGLVGKKAQKNVKFMGEQVTISKLKVSQVMEIQERAKAAGQDETANFDLLKEVIRMSATGADELTDEDFNDFPIDDLSNLSTAIMEYSGISGKDVGKGN